MDTLRRDLVRQRARALRDRVQWLLHGAMAARLDGHPADLVAPLTFLDTYVWLCHEVPEQLRYEVLAVSKNPAFAPLVELLATATERAPFTRGLVEAGFAAATVARLGGDRAAAVREICEAWERWGDLPERRPIARRAVAAAERAMYDALLGPADQERLALIDHLPDPGGPPPRFTKLGVIPVMRCPAGCRHCLFLYRPRVERRRAPAELLAMLSRLTDRLLYTGGDLTGHLDDFTEAVATTPAITTFAILLNGTFAATAAGAEAWFDGLDAALDRRAATSLAPAEVVLEISFDEHHQELRVGADGGVHERIPVANIANLIEAAVRHPRLGLVLLHKQNRRNFSRALFESGVVARLARELHRRGQRLELLSARPGLRPRRDPCDPTRVAPVITEAQFCLSGHRDVPIGLTSSLVDGYGQAALLDASEWLNDRANLEPFLAGAAPGDGFDGDLMFWYDGRVTSFSAVHLAFGNLDDDPIDRILSRHRRDPLLAALRRPTLRLLHLYGEVRNDLEALTRRATSLPHLLHTLTRDAEVRLHLTRRLAACDPTVTVVSESPSAIQMGSRSRSEAV